MKIPLSDEETIILETRKKGRIRNDRTKLSLKELADAQSMKDRYKFVQYRTAPCGYYNCLGLVFASRRVRVFEEEDEINAILLQDNYSDIEEEDVLGGDVVFYYDNKKFTHCGVVLYRVENPFFKDYKILSKWGNGHEAIHGLRDCYYWSQSTTVKFFRIKAVTEKEDEAMLNTFNSNLIKG